MKGALKIAREARGLDSLSKIVSDLSHKRIYRGGAFQRNTPGSKAWDRKRDPVHRLIDRFNRQDVQPGNFNRSAALPRLQQE